jgi:hypothetical protein
MVISNTKHVAANTQEVSPEFKTGASALAEEARLMKAAKLAATRLMRIFENPISFSPDFLALCEFARQVLCQNMMLTKILNTMDKYVLA